LKDDQQQEGVSEQEEDAPETVHREAPEASQEIQITAQDFIPGGIKAQGPTPFKAYVLRSDVCREKRVVTGMSKDEWFQLGIALLLSSGWVMQGGPYMQGKVACQMLFIPPQVMTAKGR